MRKNKISIVCPDNDYGGVAASTRLLSSAFTQENIDNEIFYIKDSASNSVINFLLNFLKSTDKNSYILLMHFESVLLGLFLRLLGYKNAVNVFHTDVVDYYKCGGLVKKTIIYCLMFFVRNKPCVFVSKESATKAKAFFKLKKASCIYNVFDMTGKVKTKKTSEEVVFGIVSRLDRLKNIDLVIRLIHSIKTSGHPVKLVIYGTGPESEKLEEYVAKRGSRSYIEFKGYCSNKEEMYSSIDALISLSSLEGLPTVILESVKFNKPVFHTDCSSGPREIMAPDSLPEEKTSSFEKTNVGYLVRNVANGCPYSDTLQPEEEEYLNYLLKFIFDLNNDNFSMDFNHKLFSSDCVVKKWIEIFNSHF